MDELARLRIRAGITEEMDAAMPVDGMETAPAAPAAPPSDTLTLMRALSANQGAFSDVLMEAGKVARNMSGPEMWSRIVRAYLGMNR
jgi:hypothetical protein